VSGDESVGLIMTEFTKVGEIEGVKVVMSTRVDEDEQESGAHDDVKKEVSNNGTRTGRRVTT
jgi:hypothetical protein